MSEHTDTTLFSQLSQHQACRECYFACDHGKHRNAKRYVFVVCNLLLGGETKVTPKTVPFRRKTTTHHAFPLHEQQVEPHVKNLR